MNSQVLHMKQRDSDEAELLERARSGETVAFGALVERYQRKIFRLALHYLRNVDDANCAVQDSFVKAFQNIREFRGHATFETWMTRITINVCLDYLKRITRQRVVSLEERVESETEGQASGWMSRQYTPEQQYLAREMSERVRATLQQLSPHQRTVFILRHYEQHSLKEIEDLTGWNIGTIKSHLFRALEKMRECLKEYHESRS